MIVRLTTFIQTKESQLPPAFGVTAARIDANRQAVQGVVQSARTYRAEGIAAWTGGIPGEVQKCGGAAARQLFGTGDESWITGCPTCDRRTGVGDAVEVERMLRGRAGQRGAHRGDQRVHRGRVSLDNLREPELREAPGAIGLVGHHGIRHQHGARPRAQQRGAGVVAGAADRERAAAEGGGELPVRSGGCESARVPPPPAGRGRRGWRSRRRRRRAASPRSRPRRRGARRPRWRRAGTAARRRRRRN